MSDLMHASIGSAAPPRHLADAPSWVRAAIDQEREKRGLPTLFKGTASTAGVKARTLRPARSLVGVAAPSMSRPSRINIKGDRGLLPEIISPAAWEFVEADLLQGRTFDFRAGHEGTPLFCSNDPEVEIDFDPIAGMLFRVRGEAANRFPWPASGYASIGFAPLATTKVLVRDQWVRQIDRMELRHIALLPPHHAPPVYGQARVLSVPPDQEIKAFVNLRCDARLATKEALGRQ